MAASYYTAAFHASISEDDTQNKCIICLDEVEEPYSTPCLVCEHPYCYDCLERCFQTALQDATAMPVRCCNVVMHYVVARGILSEEELEKYKLRFDEFNTVNPLYCPVPTCSTFISPRLFNASRKEVSCPTCSAVVCTRCKQPVTTTDHACAGSDVRQSILGTQGSKACPRCGTGVVRAYGCSHMRCHCGAHWCWHCRRPIEACVDVPCGGDLEEPDDADNEEVGPAVAIANENLAQLDLPAPIEQEPANDDANAGADIMDHLDLDLGADPMEDDDVVAWGCGHNLSVFQPKHIPPFWLVGVDPIRQEEVEIECMGCLGKLTVRCYEGDEILEDIAPGEGLAAYEERIMERLAFCCDDCQVIYCRSCMKAAEKRVEKERDGSWR